MYVHRAKKLFLSAYVDDYKMAGLKENIAPMWDLLRKNGLELEPAVSLKSNVYLGCSQREVEPDQKLIDAKSEMMQRLCFDKSSSGKPTHTNIPDLKEPSEATAPSKPKAKKRKREKLLQLERLKEHRSHKQAGGNSLAIAEKLVPGRTKCLAM